MSAQKLSSYQGGRGLLKSSWSTPRAKVKMLVVVGAVSMAIGIATTKVMLEIGSSEEQPVASAVDQTAEGLNNVVTRDASDDLLSVAFVPEVPKIVPTVAEESCLSQLIKLTATARVTMAQNSLPLQSSQLGEAREIAIAAQGCDLVTVTVEGHAAGHETEVDNLAASWQQAENTIAMLAQEGLDVRGLRPLGFGSRSFDPVDAMYGYVSFRIAPQPEVARN